MRITNAELKARITELMAENERLRAWLRSIAAAGKVFSGYGSSDADAENALVGVPAPGDEHAVDPPGSHAGWSLTDAGKQALEELENA